MAIQDLARLFEPITIKGKEFKNRIVMPPMVTYLKIGTDECTDWYGRHAQGGPALVALGATSVLRFGDELTPDSLRPVVEAIHEGGAYAGIQLFPCAFGEPVHPPDLTAKQLAEMIEHYVRAATICQRSGFDWLEPHGAHDYLLNQFFSPVHNQRTDQYGQDMAGRMRLSLAIVRAMRGACDDQTIIAWRHSPVKEGYGMAESLVFAEELVRAGVDVLSISPATAEGPGDHSAPFMSVGVPVLAAHELGTPQRALEVLVNNRAHLVGVGRQLIADPDWTRKLQEGRTEEIVECKKCNAKCYGHIKKKIPIECAQWE